LADLKVIGANDTLTKTAIEEPNTASSALKRQSVEIRTMAFFDLDLDSRG